ncbi:gamma protein [Porcine ephemerovirus 2]|uniref:Gamma protein n=1 Tax=Porcine ephemerovirus 2 TaxID=2928257 RepID=A0AAX3A737_9RHAB|nr:gamma protein [Porcine ephemerovirus 2]UNP42125.1 gamma protein [Porcine ephemerovirus 2]
MLLRVEGEVGILVKGITMAEIIFTIQSFLLNKLTYILGGEIKLDLAEGDTIRKSYKIEGKEYMNLSIDKIWIIENSGFTPEIKNLDLTLELRMCWPDYEHLNGYFRVKVLV